MDADEPPLSTPPSSDDDDLPRSPAGGLVVDVQLQTADQRDTRPPAQRWLETMVRRAAQHAGVETGELALLLVSDPDMAVYHERYCGVPGTTDVITFDHLDGAGQDDSTHVEGDLVLCVDEAQRQAAARGHDARTELLLYAVHGLLHLLGEDDHEPAAYARMHRREDDLLEALGVGRVFDPRPPQPATPPA